MAKEPRTPQPWTDFISAEPLYQALSELRKEGWSSSTGDTFFKARKKAASRPNRKTREHFYRMTCQIGHNVLSATNRLNIANHNPRVLDLCMAPGGFSTASREKFPESHIDGLTLPPDLGGYKVMARNICQGILYGDITMYISEMDVNFKIPDGHPENFYWTRPYLEGQYDLIFCGGAVVKNPAREEYRKNCEPSRLTLSQLVFALNRLKSGGSLVLLLHRVEAWNTVCLIYILSRFSDIQVVKSPKAHGVTSSFYLVAKGVDLEGEVARQAISFWKELWRYFTFRDFTNLPTPSTQLLGEDEDSFSRKLIDEFGPQFLDIARPLWTIQADNLRQAPFTTST